MVTADPALLPGAKNRVHAYATRAAPANYRRAGFTVELTGLGYIARRTAAALRESFPLRRSEWAAMNSEGRNVQSFLHVAACCL